MVHLILACPTIKLLREMTQQLLINTIIVLISPNHVFPGCTNVSEHLHYSIDGLDTKNTIN
jgi:hypothetical protein